MALLAVRRFMAPSRFYDDLAEYYDLVYPDWEASMERQGRAIARMLEEGIRPEPLQGLRVLDVAAGIGTQTLPLARLGCRMTARDLSGAAIARLRREAARRDLEIDAAKADMRTLSGSLKGPFHAVIAFDNSLPHLQNDEEIRAALEGFWELLVPGGQILVSVRDYDNMSRASPSTHPYGARTREGRAFRLAQHWTWIDRDHYRTTFVIEERRGVEWAEVVRTDALYYAVPVRRLLELMEQAGFTGCRQSEVPFYQPVAVAGRPR